MLGLGNSHCWGKLSPLKMRSVALWGPHIRLGGDFCSPRNTRTPDCRLAGQGSAWECWVPWARCGRIILSGATRGKGNRASCGVCLGSVDTEWGRVALGNGPWTIPTPQALCVLIHSMTGLASKGTAGSLVRLWSLTRWFAGNAQSSNRYVLWTVNIVRVTVVQSGCWPQGA